MKNQVTPHSKLIVKILSILLLITFSQQEAKAYSWDGKVNASYNVCDGSITFNFFVFEDNPSGGDWVVGNLVLQYKDQNGIYRRLAIVRMLNAFGDKGTPSSKIPHWNNGDNWRGANGVVINSTSLPVVNDAASLRILNQGVASYGFVYSTSASYALCGANGCGGSAAGAVNYNDATSPEPIFEPSIYTIGLKSYMSLKWKNPSAYIRNSNTFTYKMPLAITTENNGIPSDITGFGSNVPEYINTITIDPLKQVSGLTATKNASCNTVTLNWAGVQDYCPYAHYQIFRDGVPLIPISDFSTLPVMNGSNPVESFADNTAIKGQNHNYTLKIIHQDANFWWYEGQSSAGAIGKVKSPPTAPYGLTATDNRCNKSIELAWSVNQSVLDATPHTRFTVQRSTDPTFATSSNIENYVAEGARSYIDTNILNNQRYYYLVYANNGCSLTPPDFSAPSNAAQGLSPGTPPKVPTVNATLLPFNKIQVTWTNPSPFIDNFVVTRSLLTGGGTTNLSTVSKTTTSYVDSLAQICVDYVYRIKSTNTCNTGGVESDAYDTIRINPDLSTTFHTPSGKILKASKGYYPNRVELNWTNNNSASVTGWKIYRKNMNTSGADSVLIASPTASSGQYIDYTADANIFYKYTIVGEANCGTATLITNTSEDIGFRYPVGTISGNITYEGGIAVKDVKITASTSSGNSGYAMNFTGSSTSSAKILASSKLNENSPYTIEFWMKPTSLVTSATLVKKSNYSGSTHYAVEYNQSTDMIDFYYQQGGTIQKVSANFGLSTGTYVQVTAVKDSNSLKLYKNGNLLNSFTTTTALSTIPNVAVDLGYNSNNNSNKFAGNLDELRIYKRAKSTDEIAKDYNRYVNPEDNNLVAYFPFDENVSVIRNAYDLSKSNGQFNENKILFEAGVNYSSSIPTANELNNIGYTDSNGFYVINACRYTGTGQNFTMTPIFGTHSFTPSSKIEYVGEGSNIKSNVNFTDNSSFVFNGIVSYKGTNCPMEGAVVYLDNGAVIKAGDIVKSGSDGKFQLRVPIGQHFLEVRYPKHDFSVGRFPPTSGTLHNFQSDYTGIYQFVDSTLRKVVGRVVGGQVEAKKALGLGRSKNNIGKARIIFETTLGVGCRKDTVWTTDSSGEYTAYLAPLEYRVADIKIPSNVTMNFANEFGIGKILDCSIYRDSTSVKDSLFRYVDSNGVKVKQFVRADSTWYHYNYSYIYKVSPSIVMKGKYETNPVTKDSLFIGENVLTMGSTTINLTPFIPGSTTNKIKYPVFRYYNPYQAKFIMSEDYLNYDNSSTNPNVFKYPVSGLLTITSTIGTNSGTYPVDESGIYQWEFMAGPPNLLTNNIVADYSYTSPLNITFSSPGSPIVEYLPFPFNPTQNLDGVYRAYCFGAKTLGTNFVTRDVDRVSFVLRDPPGSNSFASWTTGTKMSQTTSTTTDSSTGSINNINVGVGGKAETETGGGIGAIVMVKATEIQRNISIDNTSSTAYNNVTTNSLTREVENLSTVSTSSSPDEVGHMADVFIGDGRNVIFGGALQLALADTSQCNLPNYECYGDLIQNKFKLVRYKSISISEGLAQTRFHYTTREIEEIVIPNLIALRNNVFVSDSHAYKLNFTDNTNTVKFASNNDDKNAWNTVPTTNNPLSTDAADTTGLSYTFYPSKQAKGDSSFSIKDSVVNGQIVKVRKKVINNSTDKVRQFNNQIRQWKVEMAKNEREKHRELVVNTSTAYLDNISVGRAIIQKSYTSSSEATRSVDISRDVSDETKLGLQNGFTAFGIGIQFDINTTFTSNVRKTNGNGNSNTTSSSFEYIFQDDDQGDLINLAVRNPKDGGGHIFKVLAGQTSCPYQNTEYLKWYQPLLPDVNETFPYIYPSSEAGSSIEFSPRTMQRDVPDIQVSQSQKINIPSDEAATFNLILGNLSETNHTRDYTLKVDLNSNPFGAIIKVDGLDPNRTFTIPSGVGINKTLTIEKGPIKFNYDSIMLIFHAACDVDKENIADTVYVSAHFVPACNKATLQNPGDLWTSNNITGDTIPILIKDYNYNLEGFTNIQLKYKKTNTSIWNTQKIFHKDTAGLNDPQAKLIPTTQSYITYQWPIKDLADGPYEVRLDVKCDFQNFPNIIREMPKQIGIIDKKNPEPFGTPSPADGILDPNDDISIQFNEPLDDGTLTAYNFDVRGVLNETPIRNSTSLYFNGTSNYMEIPGDINLQQRDFTFETWVKRSDIGRKQTLFSQGADANQAIEFGFDSDNKLYYRVSSGTTNEIIKSDSAITDMVEWHHLSISYNHAAELVQMYLDGRYVNGNSVNHMYTDNLATGKMQLSKNLSTNNQYFKGNLHEIRFWNKYRTLAEVAATMNISINRSNLGALFNWRLDEAEGTEAKDDIRERNATIYGATWMVDPSSKSVALNGTNQYIKVESGNYGISKEMDMTLEFWFNSSQSSVASLFSNGKGYQHTDSITAWNIEKDASGKIHVKNNNYDWVATDSNYFDGQWHHLALVLIRKANTVLYIDGNQQKTITSQKFGEFGGGHAYLGTLGYYNGTIFDSTNFLNGNIDEFRFWNTARLVEQIKRDKQNRLKGDEFGLLSYVPFEEYIEVNGGSSLTATMQDIADTSHDVIPINSATHSDMTPTLKLPRAVANVDFDFVLNNDKIIITIDKAPKEIENVTFDITTKGVKDKNGNYQQSPKTWIAYIDKNQVVWGNDAFSADKKLNDPYTISTTIANKGGATKLFTINNIPSWMTVTPTSGAIAPNSVLPVTITIDANMAIGDYENDVQLLTDFGYAEKLNIKVKCRAAAPTWIVNPANYQYSMNIIGKLRINNVISSDIEDKIAVFVGDECRGTAKVQYVPQFDDYYVFLDVYSNDATGSEKFKSKIWDASVGAILTEVTPEVVFESNTLRGTMSTPIIFNANNLFAQIIPIKIGWNWISLNVLSNDSNHFDRLLTTLNSVSNDVVKSQTSHRLFSPQTNWSGSLASMIPDKGYMLRSTVDDTLIVDGVLANPTERLIKLTTGWNWIGFNSIRNLPINQALGGLNPVHEDLIKGKNFFAVYDQSIGWIGSLAAMKPGEGYMYKSSGINSFYYPIAGYYKGGVDDEALKNTYFDVKTDEFESNMNLMVKLNCEAFDKNAKLTIGAFDDKDVCRGAIKFKYLDDMKSSIAFLTTAGIGSENLSFKLYDENAKKVYPLTGNVTYTPNALMGSLQAPMTLKVSESVCNSMSIASQMSTEDYYVKVFPIEIKHDVQIEFGGKIGSNVSFELFDIQGRSIYKFEKDRTQSSKKFALNSVMPHVNDLASGLYLLKVDINNQTKTFKLVK